jgi:hypothetical protein
MDVRAGLVAAVGLGILGAAAAAAPARGAITVTVEAGPHARKKTPVTFDLPPALKGARAVRLIPTSPAATVAVPGQVVADGRDRDRPRVAFLLDELPAGGTRTYRLEAAEPPVFEQAAVTCRDNGKEIKILIGDRPVLVYHPRVVEAPLGLDMDYRRSGQIHPLFTPSGQVVTDDFPPDHAHQHGVFFAWVNTTFEGRHLDFWNQMEHTGRITHASTRDSTMGSVCAEFQVKLRHEETTDIERPRPVLDEIWTVRAYDVRDVCLIDLESWQTTATSSPLTINKYHYGGMGIRGSRDWFDPSVKGNNPPDPSRSGRSNFLTSEGKDRSSGNHTRPRWVDLWGETGESHRPCGVALLDHPDNFRFPQPIRIHPNKPYFSFSPMVLDAFEIAPGKPYISRFRLAVHDGRPDAAAIDRLWRDYAEPPRVRVDSAP